MSFKIIELSCDSDCNVVITGGVSGIGFQVAKAMGQNGANVTILGRNAEKGLRALQELRSVGGRYCFELVDLASLESIEQFTARWGQRPIHYLMNVAGVMNVSQKSFTADSYEMHMGTNFLGHFALTARLFESLKAGCARIVTVSALVGRLKMAEFDPEDMLAWPTPYTHMRAYARSKLAGIMFACELQRRVKAQNINVTSIAVDPGTANTSLQRHVTGARAKLGRALITAIGYPINRAAENVLWAASVDDPVECSLVGPSFFIQRFASPLKVKLPRMARDESACKKLWSSAEILTCMEFSP